MDNLYRLSTLSLALDSLGEKNTYPYHDQAFYLSQLLQSGYPVADGFVVPGDVFWQYLEILGDSETLLAELQDSDLYLDIHQSSQLRNISQRLRQIVLQGNPPAMWLETLTNYLAQITTSFVELQPFLQHKEFSAPTAMLETVICPNNSEAVLAGLQQVWGQLFRARHLFCWRQAGLKLSQVNLAVLVQPLGDTIASGMITASPEQLEIEATWGLSLAIYRGEVLPDQYLINPQTGVLLKQNLGNKTRAYRLNSSQFAAPDSYLLTPLLSPEDQQSYSLNQENLEILIQICQQLQKLMHPHFTLAWQIINSENDLENNLESNGQNNPQNNLQNSNSARLVITAFTPHTNYLNVRNDLMPLKGLAVAGGKVAAIAQVVVTAKFPLSLAQNNNTWSLGMATSLLGKILVAEVVLPEWLPFLREAAGIITEQGGMTSHGAIIARELGIPSVVGVAGATQIIQNGEFLTLDGNQGMIYRQHYEVSPGIFLPSSVGNTLDSSLRPAPLATTVPDLTSLDFDSVVAKELVITQNLPRVTELMVNLSQSRGIGAAINLPVDGIGLLRSEFILTEILQSHHLSTFQDITFLAGSPEVSPEIIPKQIPNQVKVITALADVITEFAAAFAPRPVFYRSADWRSAEFPSLFRQEIPETNPILGRRGTFLYTKDPQLFDWELAALREVQQRGYGNVKLLLPFVRTVEEFSFCRQRVEQAGLFQQAQFQLWIMAEVPSVVFLLADYVRAGVQGISIGSNDLTQLILGCDRDHPDMTATLNESHPAVRMAMKQLITTARQLKIPCSICGQAPVNYPELIEQLVVWGITSISVDAIAVEMVHQAIVKAEYKLLLELARNSPRKQ